MQSIQSEPIDAKTLSEKSHAVFESSIRPLLEPDQIGKYIAIDHTSGDYVIDSDDQRAIRRAKDLRPEATWFLMRVGYPAAYSLHSRG